MTEEDVSNSFDSRTSSYRNKYVTVFIWKTFLLLILIFRNSHRVVPPVHPKEYFLKIPLRVYLAFFSFPLWYNAWLNNSLPFYFIYTIILDTMQHYGIPIQNDNDKIKEQTNI